MLVPVFALFFSGYAVAQSVSPMNAEQLLLNETPSQTVDRLFPCHPRSDDPTRGSLSSEMNGLTPEKCACVQKAFESDLSFSALKEAVKVQVGHHKRLNIWDDGAVKSQRGVVTSIMSNQQKKANAAGGKSALQSMCHEDYDEYASFTPRERSSGSMFSSMMGDMRSDAMGGKAKKDKFDANDVLMASKQNKSFKLKKSHVKKDYTCLASPVTGLRESEGKPELTTETCACVIDAMKSDIKTKDFKAAFNSEMNEFFAPGVDNMKTQMVRRAAALYAFAKISDGSKAKDACGYAYSDLAGTGGI